MKDIEFRGKDSYTRKWVIGGFCKHHEDGGPCIVEDINDEGILYGTKVDSETIGQFTGLQDKNGVKIFEDDIVQLFDKYYGFTAKGYGKIIFSYEYVGGWVVASNGDDRLSLGLHRDILEVIGNIHDNPELLKS